MISEIVKENIIPRSFYHDTLKSYRGSNVIKVITWMRRVWKSYLLKYLIQDIIADDSTLIKNIFYVNKENIEYDYIKNYHDLYKLFQEFLIQANQDKTLFVCIDEVQEIEWWEKCINSLLSTYHHKVDMYITGSNSTMLSSSLSTLIAWRYVQIEVYPLHFEEYALFAWKDMTKELFLEYIQYWWLPWIFYMNKDRNIITNYHKSVYNTIILRDIVATFGLRNIGFFENLYKYLFANIWNIFSAKSISDYLKSQQLKISPETVINYLDYGIKVYVLDLIKAVNPDTKKYFEIYNKYYVWDLWLRNALVWFDFKKDIGKLLENYVFLELKRHHYSVTIGRFSHGKEIDFIAEKNGLIKYFQVCYLLWSEETMDREYTSLLQIADNRPKYIVSFDDINHGIHDGIQHIHIMDLHTAL